ncbi:MAG: hypothetical protein ABSG59_02750 [Verrucomicrobiota bacterium]|jgi:hypothetical protein
MRNILLTCSLAIVFAGCKGGGDKNDEAPAGKTEPAEYAVQRNPAGETVVTLSPETQQRIALKVAPLQAAQAQPELTAYGSVLDPSPLAALQGDIASAQAALDAADREARRAKALFEQDENVSRKTLETSENEERMAEIKLAAARRSLELDWGGVIAGLDAPARKDLVDQLAAHRSVLLRVDLPIGQTMAGPPQAAQVTLAGQTAAYGAAFVSFAPRADPKTLGQGFLLRIDGADAALAPGAAVSARLRVAGAPVTGVAIPDSALVRSRGRTWVYLAQPENKFIRREVTLESPLEQGWFTTNGPAAGERVVVQAAQWLLAEEQKADIQAD